MEENAEPMLLEVCPPLQILGRRNIRLGESGAAQQQDGKEQRKDTIHFSAFNHTLLQNFPYIWNIKRIPLI